MAKEIQDFGGKWKGFKNVYVFGLSASMEIKKEACTYTAAERCSTFFKCDPEYL